MWAAYVYLCDAGQAYGQSGAREVFEGQVQAFFIKAHVRFQWLLDRGPHQIRHVTCARQTQIFVRQLTHVSTNINNYSFYISLRKEENNLNKCNKTLK